MKACEGLCQFTPLPRFLRTPGPWFALAWLPLLLFAPVAAAGGRDDVSGLGGLAVLLVVAAAFAAAVTMPYRQHTRWLSEISVVVLAAAVAGAVCLDHSSQRFLYPLLAIALAIGVRPRVAPSFIAALAISGGLTTGFTTWALDEAIFAGFATFMAGMSTYLIAVLTQALAALAASRRQLAASAAEQERARLSRDLHDLLGHTLSVIVVKAEAVRRLAPVDLAAAVDHAQGIESIGRDALSQVRAAVAGYRTTTLQTELRTAGDALTAAGIGAVLPGSIELDRDSDAALGWVLREGVTNVIRHAHATRCVVTIAADATDVTIDIVDDGARHTPIADAPPSASPGTGLSGLRERVEAVDGVLIAERTPTGFRLSATVPRQASAPEHRPGLAPPKLGVGRAAP